MCKFETTCAIFWDIWPQRTLFSIVHWFSLQDSNPSSDTQVITDSERQHLLNKKFSDLEKDQHSKNAEIDAEVGFTVTTRGHRDSGQLIQPVTPCSQGLKGNTSWTRSTLTLSKTNLVDVLK